MKKDKRQIMEENANKTKQNKKNMKGDRIKKKKVNNLNGMT